jgi:predicted membrane protein
MPGPAAWPGSGRARIGSLPRKGINTMNMYLLGLVLVLLGALVAGVVRRRGRRRATQALLERVRTRNSGVPHVSANVKGACPADAARPGRTAD